jgi:hypothetical protein
MWEAKIRVLAIQLYVWYYYSRKQMKAWNADEKWLVHPISVEQK